VNGWNVLRASASEKLRDMVQERLTQLLVTGWAWPFGQSPGAMPSPANRFRPEFSRTAEFFQFPLPLTA